MFQQLWQINIIHCVIRSPADYMTEWMFESGDSKTKKKKKGRPYARSMSTHLKSGESKIARHLKCAFNRVSCNITCALVVPNSYGDITLQI